MNTLFYLFKLLLVLYVSENVKAITVKPCPTNKIAPHRRSPRFSPQTRTFGHFYSLFADEDQGTGGLQEEPLADEPDDCGDIEDYDENDLSSVTREEQRAKTNKGLFGLFGFLNGHRPTQQATQSPTTVRPAKPTYSPTRPPPGGYFGTNPYRPQMQLNPSDHLKPVQEYAYEPQMMYHPGLVGAPLGHVVGVHQVRPTDPSRKIPHQTHHATHHETKHDPHKHPKPRNIQDGFFRSFIDLLF